MTFARTVCTPLRRRFTGALSAALTLLLLAVVPGCAGDDARGGEDSDTDSPSTVYDASSDSLRFDSESRIRNIRQLTFGGNNAEAYWSEDGSQLVFQSDWDEINTQGCDQIFVMNVDGSNVAEDKRYGLVSTGTGRTTCSYFMPDGRILYASTHEGGSACPAPVFGAGGRYVWPIYDTYNIYTANPDGSDTQLLIGGEGYDAEATVSPDGQYIVFTSTRSGDLELWRYEIASGEVLQLTDGLGYDGGAFFSADSKQIVWRANRPTGEEAATYQALLDDGLVEPRALNIFVADIDGSNARQVTDLPGANWAPYFHPDGERILFTTNHHTIDTNPREFDIFMIEIASGALERITQSGTFDGFPMFSPDGSRLAYSSNRNARDPRNTNVFVADWVD